ncbi:MAG TPA: asparaginase [Gemmatimonadales bacterium]|jgi:L-asparaginase|nr:asparaginase [Gemmatimonadales bacterium]
MIHLLFTGGTISMQRDPEAGGNVPTHGGEALVEFTPGLDSIGPYRIENWAMMPACHLDLDKMWNLRERVRQVTESGEVSGLVITHGTDTIEETAYLLDRTLEPDIPVAITGAMRTSSDTDWDGPKNLLDAASVAARTGSRPMVSVVFNGKVFAGRSVVKFHTTNLDAFAAPYTAPIGRVDEGKVIYAAERRGSGAAPQGHLAPTRLTAQVALIPMVVGDDGTLLDLARSSHDGVVVVAFGSGNIPPGAVAAIGRWIGDNKSVVIASRCPTGVVTPLYAFDGGGSRLVAMGAIPAGPRSPSHARMELIISLSAGVPYGS